MYSVCWGGCNQSLEWSKSTFISPLWIHSGFYIPTHGKTAPCSLHLNVIRDNWGEKKHVAHCCCSAGTPKIIPASAAASHWQHSNAARIIHSRVLSREHRAELEFRRGIAAINNNYTHSRRFRQNVSHLHMLLSLENSHALSFSVRPQIAIRRVTAFNNYKGSLQMWCIDLIQHINKQVLHYLALYHQRK